MELADCKVGQIVQEFHPLDGRGRIGHIVGLVVNHTSWGETVPCVVFAQRQEPGALVPKFAEPEMVHHANLRMDIEDVFKERLKSI